VADASVTHYANTKEWGEPPNGFDTFERLGLISRSYGMVNGTEPQVGFRFVWTPYVRNFLAACHGPRPSPKSDENT
jgi:hypothetical protein